MNIKVLKFGASWCGQCRQQDKEFEKNPIEGATLEKLDVDELEETELNDLGIKSIPVVIIKVNDEIKTRYTGLTKSSVINDFIKSINA